MQTWCISPRSHHRNKEISNIYSNSCTALIFHQLESFHSSPCYAGMTHPSPWLTATFHLGGLKKQRPRPTRYMKLLCSFKDHWKKSSQRQNKLQGRGLDQTEILDGCHFLNFRPWSSLKAIYHVSVPVRHPPKSGGTRWLLQGGGHLVQ